MERKYAKFVSWTPVNEQHGLDWQWGRKYVGTDEKLLVTNEHEDYGEFIMVWDHHRGIDCAAMRCDCEFVDGGDA